VIYCKGEAAKLMNYPDIEIDQKYKCYYQGDQYFAFVKAKKTGVSALNWPTELERMAILVIRSID
jgi:hypothetical protein